jgi:hypothetical protein
MGEREGCSSLVLSFLSFLAEHKLQHTYAPFDDNLDKRPLLIQLYKKAKDLA